MTHTQAVKIAGACIVSSALLDPMRLVMTAVILRGARGAHPELFDGAAALAAIELAIKESHT